MSTKFHKGAFHGINLARAMSEPRYAIYDGDNFVTLEHVLETLSGGYDSTGTDTGGTMILEAQLPGTALQIGTDGDQDDGSYITPVAGVTDNMIGAFDITLNSGRVLAFESKFKIVQGALVGIFVGLGEGADSDHDLVTDVGTDGTLKDEDAIGFHCLMETTDVDIDGVTRINGGDLIVGADTMSEDQDDVFHVYGFRFDGGTTVDWFYDNQKFTSQTLASATFPTGESLHPIFVIKTGEAAEKDLTIDYWKCVELLLSEDQLAD